MEVPKTRSETFINLVRVQKNLEAGLVQIKVNLKHMKLCNCCIFFKTIRTIYVLKLILTKVSTLEPTGRIPEQGLD